MATVLFTSVPSTTHGDNWRQVTWTPLTDANPDGQPFQMPTWSDRTVQVTGTFGGGTLTMQGSNDGTTWFTLVDPQGNALTWTTSDRIETVLDVPLFVRPLASGGASKSLTVIMVATKKGRV
jgi:hypothetical protein